MHSAQLFLLLLRQFWLFTPQFPFSPRNRHAFPGTQAYQIALKLSKRCQHVKKYFSDNLVDTMFFHMKQLEDESRNGAKQLMADVQEKHRRETSIMGSVWISKIIVRYGFF